MDARLPGNGPMKVLYLTPQARRDGSLTAYSFLDEEIAALASAGVRAYVLSRRAKDIHERQGVVVWPLPRERTMSMRARSLQFLVRGARAMPPANLPSVGDWYRAGRVERVAADLVRREGIDLVHSHFAWPDGLGGLLAKHMTGVPLVACLRGADILVDPGISYGARRRRFFDRNLRRLLRAADRTLYFSDYMREAAVGLGATPDRARTLQKAADLSHFRVIEDRAQARAELGLGSRPMILTVGWLIPRKGIDLLLESLAMLRDRFDFSFVVCGDGPEREALQSLTRRLSLEDRTHFVGRVGREDIPKYFGACEIFALASVLEAAGNVLFEAMAAARPIVCTAAGGPAEYVVDGETGFVVPVGDAQALAERLGMLLSDAPLRDRLGAEGRRRAVSFYSYPRLVRDIVRQYEEVLQTRNAIGRLRVPAVTTVQDADGEGYELAGRPERCDGEAR